MRYIDILLESALKGESLRHKDIESAFIAAYRRNNRLNKAIAENHRKTTIYGNVAIAEHIKAGLLPITIDIVPLDTPNNNKQGIRSSERDNILLTAPNRSITAAFDGNRLLGHKNSVAVGTLTEVYEDNKVIRANGYIWADRNEDLAEFLLDRKQIGSSWEVYYESSMRDSNGIEWLAGITFSSQTLVSSPAYGDQTSARLV